MPNNDAYPIHLHYKFLPLEFCAHMPPFSVGSSPLDLHPSPPLPPPPPLLHCRCHTLPNLQHH